MTRLDVQRGRGVGGVGTHGDSPSPQRREWGERNVRVRLGGEGQQLGFKVNT